MSADDPAHSKPRGGVSRRRSPAGRRRPEALRATVTDGHGRRAAAPGLARWLAAIAPSAARGEVAIALVSDAHMRRLNQQYRGAAYATDVLSFPASDPAHTPRRRFRPGQPETARADASGPAPVFLGDIVIAKGVAARQARDAGHALATELRVLALHGLLHLLGHDHERDEGRMARLERRLRRQGGLRASLIERAAR